MSRTYDRDRDQLKNFAARLNRTKYSDKPTPNRRNQRHESSDFSPVRYKGAGPDSSSGDCSKHFFSVKDEARDSFVESLGSLAAQGGFQIVHGRTRNMHFMPHWTPIRVTGGAHITWLPKRSDYVTPKERHLAKIAVLLEAGQDPPKISRRLRIPLRTLQRRIAYLLSYQQAAAKSGAEKEEIGALVEGGAVLAQPATQLSNAKEKIMPAKKSSRKPASAFPKDFEPFIFEMGIFPDGDGGLQIRYESADDRAYEVCDAVVKAIADSLGLETETAWTGEVTE